jgi:CRISPR-associated protein Cmr3
MTGMKQWVRIDPLDTLFFKGSEPMIAGESHEVRSVFPPMPSTFVGAFCTAILQQRGISPVDYISSTWKDTDLFKKYPLLGKPGSPSFKIVGPLFHVQTQNGSGEWYFPCPANWFSDLSGRPGEKRSVAMADIFPDSVSSLGLCGSVDYPIWLLKPEKQDLKSLSGYWANKSAFETMKKGKGVTGIHNSLKATEANQASIMTLSAFFKDEVRVGIALETGTRKAKEGHLYSATHIRLRTGVAMIVGFSEDLVSSYLDDHGILTLGGEQRIAHYNMLSEAPHLPNGDSPWLMSLSPFPHTYLSDYQWQGLPRASGPFIRMGGWDMKKHFHKPMTSYLPAGTVIRAGKESPVPFGFIRI